MHCQVRVTLSVTLLRIGESRVANDVTVDLFFLAEWQRPERFGQYLDSSHPHCDFTGPSSEQRAVYTDDVAKIEMREQRIHLLAQLILLEVELNLSGGVGKVRKGRLAVRPPGYNPASQAYRGPLLPAEEQLRLNSGMLAIETVRVRRNTSRFESLELFATGLKDKIHLVGHAAAVVELPPCFILASMNGSIPPSITFWTSGIFSSVR